MTAHTLAERGNYVRCFKFADYLSSIYQKHLPIKYQEHMRSTVDNVHPDWVHGHPFTTCNFNVNHAIKYHKDSGNYPGVFSNIIYLREGVSGGRLVVPGWGLAFDGADSSMIIFDGQKNLHGVTPLKSVKRNGYRTSIVYYTMKGMSHCYPFHEERDRFRKVQTKRASRRASGNKELKTQTKDRK